MSEAPALVWLRRDLRLDDQPALRAAAAGGRPVACCFCLDERVYRGQDAAGVRVRFLLEGLADLDARLRERGGGLILLRGEAVEEVARLARRLGAAETHACADGEPFALTRDARAMRELRGSAPLTLHHDQTLVPHDEVVREDGGAYRTYSAYARAAARAGIAAPAAVRLTGRLVPADPLRLPVLDELGLGGAQPELRGGETRALARLRAWRDGALEGYARHRDDLADPTATSRLSPYLKLGMLSPRRCAAAAERAGAAKWLAELRWRDWFKYVLHQHPDLADAPADARFAELAWPGSDADFEAWTRGETGFGLVDAGMRQLASTGYLPNRVRMVCASFLVKHLHVDWRRGERHFRDHLVDGDLSSNAGNWQWVAGTGLDAAPFFRIFNPLLQERKFDPDGAYVRRWAPDRPAPLVDLALERERALELYRAVS